MIPRSPTIEGMSEIRMHPDEIAIDAGVVARLVATQFPGWASLPIEAVPSAGTDNALYRLGTDMVIRLPRRPSAATQVEKEHAWLPVLAPHLPLAVPAPLEVGAPGEGYPRGHTRFPGDRA
jgi:aminoglycoside phosphotransferase (APT) family kinase protein